MTRQMIVAALICASGGLVAKTLTVDEKGGADATYAAHFAGGGTVRVGAVGILPHSTLSR